MMKSVLELPGCTFWESAELMYITSLSIVFSMMILFSQNFLVIFVVVHSLMVHSLVVHSLVLLSLVMTSLVLISLIYLVMYI